MKKGIILQVGVKVFLKNRESKYLLLERSKKKYPNIKNLWDIPGGRIIPGTSLLENIQREVFEETKLKISREPKLIFAQDIIRLPEKHIVRLTFTSATNGKPLLNDEHIHFKWLSVSEMKKQKGLDEFTREVLERDSSKL